MENTTSTANSRSTKATSPPSLEPRAVKKVFAIPELLEMILLHTDEPTLFVVQSVNQTFNGMISGSTATQKRMCLLPTSDPHHLTQILARVRARQTTYPFKIHAHDTRYSHSHVEVEMACDWLQQHNYDDPDELYDHLKKSMQSGSWRQISIKSPSHKSMFVQLTCEQLHFEELQTDEKTTLGHLLDLANEAIKQHLGHKICCDLECCTDYGYSTKE